MSKLMMLVAAKWREFSNINPHLQAEQSESNETEYMKPSRSRPAKESAKDPEDDEDEDEDDDDSKNRKRRGSRIKKASKKASKVPTLKIKLGKRKRGSSVRKQYFGFKTATDILKVF